MLCKKVENAAVQSGKAKTNDSLLDHVSVRQGSQLVNVSRQVDRVSLVCVCVSQLSNC